MNTLSIPVPQVIWDNQKIRWGLWIISLLLLGLTSCKSTKKAYEKGEYETAVFNSIERLRKSPDNKKSRETLSLAYPLLKDYQLERVHNAGSRQDALRWEVIMAAYKVMNKAYDEVQRAPAAKSVLPNAVSYASEYNDARLKACEARYNLAEQDLDQFQESEDREYAKRAYAHYEKVMDMQSDYQDTEARMEHARELATLWIEIRPIPIHSRSLELSNEFFENQLAEFIRDYPTSPFIQFTTPTANTRSNPKVDQIIEMKFDDFVVGQIALKETVVQRKKDSVSVGEVAISEDSTQTVFGTVEAEVHQFQKFVMSKGLLDFKIIDAKGASILSQRKFPGSFEYYDYWGFFNGDERALDEKDQHYVKKKQSSPDPLPQDLFKEFTKPIFDQVTAYVAEYYKNY